MAKVFVVNDGGHNYSDARRFGEVRFCTSGELDKFDTAQMYRQLQASLLDALPEDYILVTSLTSLCSIACAMFAARFGHLNMLLYKDNQYIERTIVFYNPPNKGLYDATGERKE